MFMHWAIYIYTKRKAAITIREWRYAIEIPWTTRPTNILMATDMNKHLNTYQKSTKNTERGWKVVLHRDIGRASIQRVLDTWSTASTCDTCVCWWSMNRDTEVLPSIRPKMRTNLWPTKKLCSAIVYAVNVVALYAELQIEKVILLTNSG